MAPSASRFRLIEEIDVTLGAEHVRRNFQAGTIAHPLLGMALKAHGFVGVAGAFMMAIIALHGARMLAVFKVGDSAEAVGRRAPSVEGRNQSDGEAKDENKGKCA